MNDITKRYLSLISQLIEIERVKDSKDFANAIGVSVSSITEISKGRSNVGLAAIQKTVLKFPAVNLDWLISGNGKSFETKCAQNVLKENEDKCEDKIEDKRNMYETSSNARDPRDAEILELHKKHITLLEQQVAQMADHISDLKKELEELYELDKRPGFVVSEASYPAASLAATRVDKPKSRGDNPRLNRQ